MRKDVDVGDTGDGSWFCRISVGGAVCFSVIESLESDVERLRLKKMSSSSSGDREHEPKKSGVEDSGAMGGETRASLRPEDEGVSNEKFSNMAVIDCVK